MTLAERIDAQLAGRVLVFGSPPPEGRDLDLLAPPDAHDRLAEWLGEQGFLERGGEWVRFRDCSVEALDLVPVSSWSLSDGEAEALLAEALPIEGFRNLVRPAPHHIVLMLARRLVEGDGSLDVKRLTRLEHALEEDPDAWRHARERASAWRSTRALAALEGTHGSGGRVSRAERAAALAEWIYAPGRTPSRARARAWLDVLRRNPERAQLVSFSGLDGAGKSSQAEALQDTLALLGFDVAIQWTRLEWTTLWENPWLGVVGWPARTSVALVNRARARTRARAARTSEPPAALEPSAVRERSELLSQLWATVIALAHASAQRRETRTLLRRRRVVLCDRYTLDAAAHLRFRYGEQRRFGFQIRLIDRLSPRPTRAYFLDIPADTAWARKAEQYSLDELRQQARLYREECERLGITRLDGARPREELCAEIAEAVWRALRGS